MIIFAFSMRIWTTQSLSLWHQLQKLGVAYASTAKSLGSGDYKEAYEWMAAQMVQRVGPPPLPEVKFPLWGWQQVGSYKKEYHGSLSDCDEKGKEYVFITADIPDDQILLSDFYWWHAVLNHTYADMLKHKNEPDEEAAIIRSWDNVFDLSQCGHGYKHRRNRWIQATFWELRMEWVKEFFLLK